MLRKAMQDPKGGGAQARTRNALAALAVCSACSAYAADVAQTAKAVVERTNAFRKAQGLEPVSDEPALQQAAQEFARFMAKTGKYGHTADGRRPPQRAAAQGYEYCIVSENIAYQYRSSGYDTATLAREMVEGWKQSPEHRKNMLQPAVTETGVGIAQGDEGRYFGVQMFGRPKSAAIRFSVRNNAGGTIEYRTGERDFSLGTRATRTHMVCRATEIRIALASQPEPFSARAQDGTRYTVTATGVEVRHAGR